MNDIESYLIWLRLILGPEQYIIVPDTSAYHQVMKKLNDERIILKYPNMDLSRYARQIKKAG